MSSNRKPETDLSLLLRRGDPAAEGESLQPADAARMRRSMLAEIEAAGRSPSLPWRAVLAAAGGAALVLALGVAWWRLEDGPHAGQTETHAAVAAAAEDPVVATAAPEPAKASPGAAAVPPRPAGPGSPAPPQLARRIPATGASAPMSRPPTRPRRARPGASAVQKAPARSPEAAVQAARQIEFETPGGTRVVWVLDPSYQALSTEVEAR